MTQHILKETIALIRKHHLKIATAESCTGGYIAHLLTQEEGASDYFLGAIIAYANDVKKNILKIPSEVLETETAVSATVAKTMLENLLQQIDADFGIAITGYLSGMHQNLNIPHGKVFVAVGNKNEQQIHELKILSPHRIQNIETASFQSIDLLKNFIAEILQKNI